MKLIPYGRQSINEIDISEVKRSLKSNLITTGQYVEKFEKKINSYLDCNYSITCNSGTSGLYLSLKLINLTKNDIVIMPAINFIASYNICKMFDAKIYLADVDKFTGQMTPKTLLDCIKTNNIKSIKTIITMYNGGFPENVLEFYKIKKKYGSFLIEDACHALGASYLYKKKYFKVGSCKHSDLAIFSLHPIKTITSGEGGIVTTNNKKFYERLKILRSHGIKKSQKKHWQYDVIETSLNFRLSDLNCALGLSQLNRIKKFISARKKIYDYYRYKLKNYSDYIIFPNYDEHNLYSYHLTIISLNLKNLSKNKIQFLKYLKNNKIIAQQNYIPIYKFKVFDKKIKKNIASEYYYKNALSLPIFTELNKKKQNFIINLIVKFIDKYKKKIKSYSFEL